MPSKDTKPLAFAAAGLLIAALLLIVFLAGVFAPRYISDISLNAANLVAGPLPTIPTCQPGNSAYFAVVFNNPHPATNISSITLWANSLNTTVAAYFNRSNSCAQISPGAEPGVAAGTQTAVTVYFGGKTASNLPAGQTYNYAINFTDGHFITGTMTSK